MRNHKQDSWYFQVSCWTFGGLVETQDSHSSFLTSTAVKDASNRCASKTKEEAMAQNDTGNVRNCNNASYYTPIAEETLQTTSGDSAGDDVLEETKVEQA